MEKSFGGRGLRIDGMVFLSPRDALAALGEGALLIDLRDGLARNGRTFEAGDVILLPYRQLDTGWRELPAGRPLILADCVGLDSKRGARFLLSKGLREVASLNGGMVDWERDGMPTGIDRGGELSGGCACRLSPGGKPKRRG